MEMKPTLLTMRWDLAHFALLRMREFVRTLQYTWAAFGEHAHSAKSVLAERILGVMNAIPSEDSWNN